MCGDSLGISARLGICGSSAQLEACLAACAAPSINCFNACYGDGGWQAPLSTSEKIAYPCAAFVLLLLSLLVSCMMSSTLGLDLDAPQTATDGSNSRLRKQASRVAALRSEDSLLLTTLLVASTLVNVGFVVLISAVLGMVVGFLVAFCLILVVVEIVPPSLCARHSLRIAAGTVGISTALLWLLYPLAYPLSKLLDRFLNPEEGQGMRNDWNGCRVFHCWDTLDDHEPASPRAYILNPLATKEDGDEEEGERDEEAGRRRGTEGGDRSRSPSFSSQELSHTLGFEEMDAGQRMAMAGFGTNLPRMASMDAGKGGEEGGAGGGGGGGVGGGGEGAGAALVGKDAPKPTHPHPQPPSDAEVRIDMEGLSERVAGPRQGLGIGVGGGVGMPAAAAAAAAVGGLAAGVGLTAESKTLHDHNYAMQHQQQQQQQQQQQRGGGGGDINPRVGGMAAAAAGDGGGLGGGVGDEDESSLGDAEELVGGRAVWQRYEQAKMMAAKAGGAGAGVGGVGVVAQSQGGGGSGTMSGHLSTEWSGPSGPMESEDRFRTGQTPPLSDDEEEGGGEGGRGGVGGVGEEGARSPRGVGELSTVHEYGTESEGLLGSEMLVNRDKGGGGGNRSPIASPKPPTPNPNPDPARTADGDSSRHSPQGMGIGARQLSNMSIWSSPEGTPQGTPRQNALSPTTSPPADAGSWWSSPDRGKASAGEAGGSEEGGGGEGQPVILSPLGQRTAQQIQRARAADRAAEGAAAGSGAGVGARVGVGLGVRGDKKGEGEGGGFWGLNLSGDGEEVEKWREGEQDGGRPGGAMERRQVGLLEIPPSAWEVTGKELNVSRAVPNRVSPAGSVGRKAGRTYAQPPGGEWRDGREMEGVGEGVGENGEEGKEGEEGGQAEEAKGEGGRRKGEVEKVRVGSWGRASNKGVEKREKPEAFGSWGRTMGLGMGFRTDPREAEMQGSPYHSNGSETSELPISSPLGEGGSNRNDGKETKGLLSPREATWRSMLDQFVPHNN